MGERARGVVLYACAGLMLAGGGLWWFRAAPRDEVDPQLERWRSSAEQMLPDIDKQESADTLALAAGTQREVLADVGDGSFLVSVICVGGDDSQVRISLGDGDDSGRGLDCTGDHTPDNFNVGIADQLRMNVSVSATGPVVFRYSVLRVVN
ncbi:DUF6023 family protein [Micromonosporaceae bacterium Da 78-11]